MTEDPKEPKAWEGYEEVACYLLEKMSETLGLGLERVEGKQKLVGKSTDWTVDGKGVKTEDGAIVIIECRRYTTSKLNQGDIGEFAYRIGDVGAAGGIVVTPIGVQEGGKKIAKYEGIEEIHLDKDATTTDFVLEFLERVFIGRSAELRATGTLTAEVKVSHPDEPAP